MCVHVCLSIHVCLYICLSINPQLKTFQISAKFPSKWSIRTLGHENPPSLALVFLSVSFMIFPHQSHTFVCASPSFPAIAFSPPSFSQPWSFFRSLIGYCFSPQLLQPFLNIFIHCSLKSSFDYNIPLKYSILSLLCLLFFKGLGNLRKSMHKCGRGV